MLKTPFDYHNFVNVRFRTLKCFHHFLTLPTSQNNLFPISVCFSICLILKSVPFTFEPKFEYFFVSKFETFYCDKNKIIWPGEFETKIIISQILVKKKTLQDKIFYLC
jgi:hypothetical protein